MPFRFGVAGAGRMGRNHVTALQRSSIARVVAVADPSADALQILDSPGISLFPDVQAMLERGGLDGVIVSVPTTVHLATLKQVIGARIPVLAEKPLGLSAWEAQVITGLAADAGLPLQVGFWRRFVPLLRELRDRIRSGALGDLYAVYSFQWDGVPPSDYFRRNSGGIFADMGVHDFEQTRWLTGQEFGSVTAISADAALEPWPGDPESVVVLSRLSSGTSAVISLGRRFPLGDVCKVEVFGTRDHEECRFLWPPSADATFFAALLTQAESFVRHVGGDELEGASGVDALAALIAAGAARDSLTLAAAHKTASKDPC
jgi:myo-inositol 2-dehydrogenase / D-chiro-inositol 1-dehydrogenase